MLDTAMKLSASNYDWRTCSSRECIMTESVCKCKNCERESLQDWGVNVVPKVSKCLTKCKSNTTLFHLACLSRYRYFIRDLKEILSLCEQNGIISIILHQQTSVLLRQSADVLELQING